MAQHERSGDELIDQAEEAEAQTGGRETRAANLFDIRRIIGGLFLLYGVVLFVMGLGASEADKRRADGINVNLSVGIALLLIAAFFIAWALLRPLGRELQEADRK
jgi:NADH:ubiquinone oxidoreductase subunit 4 (subunit M)